MLVLAGLFALIGFKKLRKLRAPEKTIASVNELKNLVPGQATKKPESRNRGMFS